MISYVLWYHRYDIIKLWYHDLWYHRSKLWYHRSKLWYHSFNYDIRGTKVPDGCQALSKLTVVICKPNRYNIVQNVVQFVQYCKLVPIRTICTICTTTFTNIVQKVSINVVQFIRKGFELIVQHVVQWQYRKEYLSKPL